MQRFLTIAFCCLFQVSVLLAQYTDKELFQAYLLQDMPAWKAYIDHVDWSKADTQERLRLINYEYGYLGYTLDVNKSAAKPYLAAFRKHVEEMRPHMSKGHYEMYSSSINAYDYMLDASKLLSCGMQAFKLCNKAAEIAPTDPLVMTLKGNVDFYAPALFGGSKKRALQTFLDAEKRFSADKKYQYCWNYPSMMLCIAQCYEKQGNITTAIERCEKLLQLWPDHKYVRDTYLPQLRNKKKK